MKRNFRYITKFEEETRAVTPVNLSNNTLSLGQMQKLMKAGLELLKDSYGVDMKGGYSDSQMVA